MEHGGDHGVDLESLLLRQAQSRERLVQGRKVLHVVQQGVLEGALLDVVGALLVGRELFLGRGFGEVSRATRFEVLEDKAGRMGC